MDSITHFAVGACIGEAFLGKQLGRRALLWGALAQSAPDMDVVATIWSSTAENLLAHRGFTHSFFFAALLTPLFAFVAYRLHFPHNISPSRMLWFFGVAIFGHVLLDGLNNYGTAWFEPFSHARISFNMLFVADPFFSVVPGIAALVLFLARRRYRYHKLWAMAGLSWCVVYIGYCAYNKINIEREVHRLLEKQAVSYTDTFITPTVMNNWLWYVVAADDKGFHFGYRSVFDRRDTLELHYHLKQDELLKGMEADSELALLKRFSQGWYTVENIGDTLLFNDLRFGQIAGWRDPMASNVFYFYLQYPDRNELVIQRGRFAGWDRGSVGSLLARIRGN